MSPAAVPVVGSLAPDFTARTQHGEPVRLSDLRGRRPVVVVFYPYAFSRVCTSELGALRDRPDLLAAAEFLAVSCDPMFTLRAYAEAERLEFALLSDFWPHGAIASSYGVFDADRGCALRGTFVIDPDGVVRWSVVNPNADARDPDDYARALAELGCGLG
ncbi:alkyl hydroperoxide reductase/ Thiol specific antioxidant/ Mal allergen [Kribbella flavida DSM 17836]|uniref:Alkyl hydroperoxide reductase E n=1 Tax=Kribbella flavida (strain DSM 17836 / JCM 10339 / NBRC 14399) TaxID=479435 RepID=D2PXK5_KRIFD|nr:peroxiredoxin [Kribbella flavida]ADB31647.1 alkyl hydroperoxide reductase/ Thiol specific antioxidant/ Mal allergen [Kribbella flavida DSM 17836]